MRDTLKLPKVGDAVDKVVDVLAKVGERFAVGQSVLLVGKHKAKLEIPPAFAGPMIEIFISVSKEMATGTPMLAIEA